jgi:hypothetical protein
MNRSDLADLSAFVAVADRLSFSAAASQLGVTPRLSAIRCGSWKSALAYACCTYDAQRVADRRRPALARSVAAGNRRIHFFHVTVFTQPGPSRTFSDVQVSQAPCSVQLVATVPLRRRGRCPHQRRRAVDTDLGDKTLDHRRWEKTRGVITPREPTTHFHRY